MRIGYSWAFLGIAFLVIFFCSSKAASEQSKRAPNCPIQEAEDYFKPSCVMRTQNGQLFIPRRYLKHQKFNRYGLTALLVESFGAVYVNRNGRVVIRDVALIDNGPDDFHHGLVRIARNGQYGYADPTGHIVLPMQYSCALNMKNEYEDYGPLVCVGCRVDATQGEHHACLDGKWFHVDLKGNLTPAKSLLGTDQTDGPH